MTATHSSEIAIPAQLIAGCAALAARLREIDDRLRPALERLEQLARQVDVIVAADHDAHRHLSADERDRRMDAIVSASGLAECYRICDDAGIIPDCDLPGA